MMTKPIERRTHRARNLVLAVLVLFFLTQTHPLLPRTAAWSTGQEQQPEISQELIDRVSKLLESASSSDRAWGAYLVQKNGLTRFTPNLIEAVRT